MTKSKRNIVTHKKLNRYNRITKKYGGNRFTRRIRDLFRKKPQKIERIVRKGFDDWEPSKTPSYRYHSIPTSPTTRRKFNLPSWLRLPKFLTRKKRQQHNLYASPIRISDYPNMSQTIVSGPDLILDSPSDFDNSASIGLESSPGRRQAEQEYQTAVKRGEDILQTNRLPSPSSLSNIKSPTRIDLEKRAIATGFVRPDQVDIISDQDLRDVIWGKEQATKLSYDNMMKYIKRNPNGTFKKYIMGTEDAQNYLNNRTQPLEKIYNQALADYLKTNPSKTNNQERKKQLADNLLSVFDSPGSVSSPVGSPTYDSDIQGGSSRRRRRTRRTRRKSIRKNKKYKKNR
uniref:Uncharacterized protein n=1 Tax=viral metagenome TaxID=1070528 RepID=A0A6C0AZ72_9ZZZZ|tara:strand:- start:27874 stop:28905 length:1032 start_codon:yes stop_codon:yes gene_type:complete